MPKLFFRLSARSPARRRPGRASVSDIVAQIAIHRRVAQLVAIHASDHGFFLLLPKPIAVLDVAVAHGAVNVRVEVLLMTEIDKVRKFVNRLPGKQAVVGAKLNQLLDCGAVALDCRMARHALGGPGNLHLAGGS